MKLHSLLKFATALIAQVIMAFVFSFVINIDSQGSASFVADFKHIFFGMFALNIVLGAISAFTGRQLLPSMSLRDDSLVVNDNTWAGTFAPYFNIPALFEMDSFNKGILFFKDGIKKQHTIDNLNFNFPLQTRVANPVDNGGDITIDGRVLIPLDEMVYQRFNPRSLEGNFSVEEMTETLLARQLTPNLENYIGTLITGRTMEQNENGIWMGSLAYAALEAPDPRSQIKYFDGFIKLFLGDPGVYQVPSPVTLTAGNIQSVLYSLYTAVAQNNKALVAGADRYKKMKYIVSINTRLLYEENQVAQTFKNIDMTRILESTYKGYEVVSVAGMPDNTVVFTNASASTDGNLWLGMNSILDEAFLLARYRPDSEEFFFKMNMKVAVQYAFSNKVFLYTTLTSANFTV